MVSSPLAGILMHRSPWHPLILGLTLLVLATFMSLVFPETLKFRNDEGEQDDGVDSPNLARKSGGTVMHKILAKAREDIVDMWEFVIGNKHIAVLTVAVVFAVFGRYVQEMLLQFATKRFGWGWDEVRNRPLVHDDLLENSLTPRRLL